MPVDLLQITNYRLISFVFNNFGFASFSFILGIILGIMLFDLGGLVTIMFLLFNTTFLIAFSRTKKRM